VALNVLAGLRGAVAFLTRIPIPTDGGDWDRFRSFPAGFVAVAYLIGALAAIPFLAPVPPTVAAFGYLLALVVVVGIPHLDGVADLGDAAAAHGTDAARRALKDTQAGVGAVVAVAVVVAGVVLAAIAVAALPPLVAAAVVVAAEVGAKLGMATVACLGTAAHEGMGSAFTSRADPPLLVGPLALAIPAAVAVAPASAAAVAAGPLVAVLAVRRTTAEFGGVNGDVFGATNELGRLFGLHGGVIAWTLS